MFYVHKYTERLEYGGPEEGGWHYTSQTPVESDLFHSEDEAQAYEVCSAFNEGEAVRRREEEDYDFYSVLAYKSTHYAYDVTTDPIAVSTPQERPHYE